MDDVPVGDGDNVPAGTVVTSGKRHKAGASVALSQRNRTDLRPSHHLRGLTSTKPVCSSSEACCFSDVNNAETDLDLDMCDENPPMADEQLQKLLTRLQEDPEYATEWKQRRHAAELNWKKVRHVVAQTTIAAQAIPPTDIRCSKCNIRAPVVRCLTCLDSEGGYSLMCGICDEEQHPHAQFHVRQVWDEGYYKAIPAQQCLDGSGQPVCKGEIFSCFLTFASG